MIFDHETAAEVADELAEEIAGYGDGPEYDAILAFGAFSYPGNKRANEAMMRVRRKLDAGLGEHLFGEYRTCKIGITQDVSDVEIAMQGARFKTLILAALMMGVGAKITDTQKAHLRKVCAIYDGFLPECGVVGSGERQFLFALRTYTAGKPRDWTRLNCYTCGRTSQDTGAEPFRCPGECWNFFCNEDCQQRLSHVCDSDYIEE